MAQDPAAAMIVDDQTPFKGTAQGVALRWFGMVQIKRIEIFLRRECENALLSIFCLHRAKLGAAEMVGIGGAFGKKQRAGGKCVDGLPDQRPALWRRASGYAAYAPDSKDTAHCRRYTR